MTNDLAIPTQPPANVPTSPHTPRISSPSASASGVAADDHNEHLLFPQGEVIEAIRNYVSSYFQLGFLHKAIFIERYRQDPSSVPVFLLLAICSVAAPFTPCLVERHGGKQHAKEVFLNRADNMYGSEMLKPTLERAQACE
jgi:hypothetical protein